MGTIPRFGNGISRNFPNSVSLKRLERSKAVERLKRLERTGPRGKRSEAIERLERFEHVLSGDDRLSDWNVWNRHQN